MSEDKILASEELFEQIPELAGAENVIEQLVLLYAKDANSDIEIAGPVSSVLFADDPEIEIKLDISSAFVILRDRRSILLNDIKIAHKKIITIIDGNYQIHAAKILDINLDSQTCILALGLKSATKTIS